MLDFFVEFARVAKAQPHATAMISKHRQIDCATVQSSIENVAANALASGLKPGQLVYVDMENRDAGFLVTLGLMRAGLTVAILKARTDLLLNDVIPQAVITDHDMANDLAKRTPLLLKISRAWFQPNRNARRAVPQDPDYSLVFSSSGSTGYPKLILKSRENINQIMAQNMRLPFYSGRNSCLSILPEQAAGSFTDFLIVMMTSGYVIRVVENSVRNMIDMLSVYNPSYLKMAPISLVQFLTHVPNPPPRFRKIEYIRLIGSYCSVATRHQALEKYAHSIFTPYGSTEIAVIACGNTAELGDIDGPVGFIDPCMHVEAIDDDGNALAPGTEGEIRIRPPREAATRYLTRDGTVDVLKDGWYYTGDYGRVDTSGLLVITGRKSAIINIGGTKINPEVVETALILIDGIDDVAVTSRVERHGFQSICALVTGARPPDLASINNKLRKDGRNFHIESIKSVPDIPRNDRGKVDRNAARALAAGD